MSRLADRAWRERLTTWRRARQRYTELDIRFSELRRVERGRDGMRDALRRAKRKGDAEEVFKTECLLTAYEAHVEDAKNAYQNAARLCAQEEWAGDAGVVGVLDRARSRVREAYAAYENARRNAK